MLKEESFIHYLYQKKRKSDNLNHAKKGDSGRGKGRKREGKLMQSHV